MLTCTASGVTAMPRLFTGLEIPAEIGQTLSNLRGGLPGARWIDPENYHVTLALHRRHRRPARQRDRLDAVRRQPQAVRGQACRACELRRPASRARWSRAVEPSRPLIELQAEQERLMQRARPRSRGPQIHAARRRWRGCATPPAATSPTISRCAATSRRRTFKASRFVLFSSRAPRGGGPLCGRGDSITRSSSTGGSR